MTLAAILVVGLGVYRAVRLVTNDHLSEPFRDGLVDWAWADPDATPPILRAGAWRSWAATLFTCPQCLGVWAAGLAVLWWYEWPRWPLYLAAVCGAQSLLASAAAKWEH